MFKQSQSLFIHFFSSCLLNGVCFWFYALIRIKLYSEVRLNKSREILSLIRTKRIFFSFKIKSVEIHNKCEHGNSEIYE